MRIIQLLPCTPVLILFLCVRADTNNVNIDEPHHPPSATATTWPLLTSPTPTPTINPENVFVPLKKWKEQKIQDIESRVKKDKQLYDNYNNNNLIQKQPKRPRLRFYYPNNFSSTRRQFLFNQIFSSTCPFHLTSTTINTYGHAPIPAPYNPPVRQQSNPAAPSATISEKPKPSPNSINSADESPAPLLKSIGNKVRKLRDSVSSTIAAAANVSATATAHFSPPHNHINNPSQPNVNISSSSSVAHPSAIATPTTTPTILPSYNKLSLAIASPNPLSIAASPASSDKNNIQEQQLRTNENNNIPPMSPDTESVTNGRRAEENTPRPTPVPFTIPSSTDEVAHAASAPVVLKRRSFNFASQGAGAQILAASANAVGAKNIIVENDDKYMLAPCDDTTTGGGYRWVDIELSEYVIMESVQTGNFEHYSSAARKFAVLGSEHYPPKQWNTLGVFDFKDTRGIQTFNITYKSTQERKVSRFLRVVYAGKRGYEYYCPISIFRAFGKNLIADLKDGLETPLIDQQHNQAQNPTPKGTKSDKNALNINEINLADEHRMLLENNLTSLEQNVKENAKLEADVAQNEAEKSNNNEHGNTQHGDGNGETQHGSGNGNNDLEKSTEVSEDQQKSGDQEDGNGVNNDSADEAKGQPLTTSNGDISTDDQIVLDVVREETLSPVSGNDNIFRRVARMIRLLELNQSLTNQYIDTQLSRFAQALAGTQTEQVRMAENHGREITRSTQLNIQIEKHLRELHNASRRRDMLTCTLLVTIGILCGINWIMWTAIVAMRNVTDMAEMPIGATGNHINGNVGNVMSPISSPDGSALQETGNSNADSQGNVIGNSASARTGSTISTISSTASVDGVHVQMTDVRHTRRRRRRRWTEPGTCTSNSDSNSINNSNSNSNSNSASIGNGGRPPVPVGNSPSRRHRTDGNTCANSPSRRNNNGHGNRQAPFVSNSFHPLTAGALLEYEQHDVPPRNR